MFRKIFCVLLLSLVCFTVSFAQDEIKRWEYLIVWETSRFNELGKNGWELVGISSELFGENQNIIRYIFKRPLDEDRTRREAELRRRNEETERLQNEQKVKFINLDTVDYLTDKKTKEKTGKEKLKSLLNNLEGVSVLSADLKANFRRDDYRFLKAEIVIDGSDALLIDGNKYRSSEIDKFVRESVNKIYNLFDLKTESLGKTPRFSYTSSSPENGKGIYIQISIVLKHKGASKIITTGYFRVDWDQLKKF